MNNKTNYEYLLSDLSSLKGVGTKTKNLLKKKNINNLFDLLWKLPKSYTDRSLSSKIKDLKIGEIQTVTIIPQKYNFPRIRKLPNRVLCSDETGEIDCIFFNSYEGYIKKILPLGKEITVSGKIGHFRNKYQITNPKYISEDSALIKQVHNKYSLTDGISEKIYNKILSQIIANLPDFSEWYITDIGGSYSRSDEMGRVKKNQKSQQCTQCSNPGGCRYPNETDGKYSADYFECCFVFLSLKCNKFLLIKCNLLADLRILE